MGRLPGPPVRALVGQRDVLHRGAALGGLRIEFHQLVDFDGKALPRLQAEGLQLFHGDRVVVGPAPSFGRAFFLII